MGILLELFLHQHGKGFRISLWPAASHTRTPAGTGIIAMILQRRDDVHERGCIHVRADPHRPAAGYRDLDRPILGWRVARRWRRQPDGQEFRCPYLWCRRAVRRGPEITAPWNSRCVHAMASRDP
jgi:hypothetical protein